MQEEKFAFQIRPIVFLTGLMQRLLGDFRDFQQRFRRVDHAVEPIREVDAEKPGGDGAVRTLVAQD